MQLAFFTTREVDALEKLTWLAFFTTREVDALEELTWLAFFTTREVDALEVLTWVSLRQPLKLPKALATLDPKMSSVYLTREDA
ncbi:hypothetical protein Q3G72_025326 [Acer saccharum]|nr:hypothetical protein Q3G72_025326 [Acer saccharum]